MGDDQVKREAVASTADDPQADARRRYRELLLRENTPEESEEIVRLARELGRELPQRDRTILRQHARQQATIDAGPAAAAEVERLRPIVDAARAALEPFQKSFDEANNAMSMAASRRDRAERARGEQLIVEKSEPGLFGPGGEQRYEEYLRGLGFSFIDHSRPAP